MRHQALLPITFLLLLLLGCTGPSINALECVERSWFCPQCKAFIPKGCICKSCGGKFALTRQFLDKEKAALIAHLESIQEQVSKDDWADFLTQCQRRNWICKQCRWYNQQFDYCCDTCKTRRQEHQNNQEQQALVACLTQLLERLRSVGIAHSSSFQRQNGWVCSRCQCFNVADRCKKCLIEKYNPDPSWLAQEQDAFIAYVDNVVSRFKEDQQAYQAFRQRTSSREAGREASPAQPRYGSIANEFADTLATAGVDAAHSEAFLAQQAAALEELDVDVCPICRESLAAARQAHKISTCPYCKCEFCKECCSNWLAQQRANDRVALCPHCNSSWNRASILFQ